jgi:cellobiose-specific phosphotransferase system component IIC
VTDSMDGPCLLVACDPSGMGTNLTKDWIRILVTPVNTVCSIRVYTPFWYVYCRQ